MHKVIKALYIKADVPCAPTTQGAKRTITFDLRAVEDFSALIATALSYHPGIILINNTVSLAEFAQLDHIINTTLTSTGVILLNRAGPQPQSDTLYPKRYYLMPAPASAKELFALLHDYCDIENESELNADKTLSHSEALAYYEHELQQEKLTQRNLARQLWRERERLAISQTVAKTGSWETEVSTQATVWSEETHRIFGTDPTSFQPTHQKFLDCVHPEDRARVDAAFQKSLSDTHHHSIVHRIIRPDGSQLLVEERWCVIELENGKAVRVVGACRDITEQQAAEDDRDRLFQLSGDMLSITSHDGILLQVNPAWTKILGWEKEQLENCTVFDFVFIEDREKTRHIRSKLQRGEPIKDFQNRYYCADGSVRWISWNSYPLLDSRKMFSIGRDITESKLAEQELIRLDDRLQLILSSVNMGYWDIDSVNNKTWRSKSYAHCFGYKELPSGWNYKTFIQHIHPEDRDFVYKFYQESAMTRDTAFRIEFRVIWPDQSVHWLYNIGQAIRDSNNELTRVAGVLLDISERKQLEEQLSQAQRLDSMGQLTSGISHDFNNLLTVIIGNAEILQEELVDNEELFPLADMIIGAADRGSELIKHMLAFARKQNLVPKTLNVNELIQSSFPLLQRSLGESIEIVLHLDNALWMCRIDPTELESTILNLCINARDAMAKQGRLTIETANHTQIADNTNTQTDLQSGDFIKITVTDEGIGMSPEVLAHIFEPFYTTKSQGSGLGLAMVYGFIKQSGGFVQVHSSPDNGTRIELFVPALHDTPREQS